MSFLGGWRHQTGLGARPIPLPIEDVKRFIQDELVPQVRRSLERLRDDGMGDVPIGNLVPARADYEVSNVRGSRKRISVFVESELKKDRNTTDAVIGGYWSPHQDSITLLMNGNLAPNDFLVARGRRDMMQPMSICNNDWCLEYGLFNVLIHELTHAADIHREATYSYQELKKATSGDDDIYETYFNDPIEVRAFMRQIVHEVIDSASLLKPHVKSRSDLVRKSLLLSRKWRAIESKLSAQNRELILKAVYDALTREGLLT